MEFREFWRSRWCCLLLSTIAAINLPGCGAEAPPCTVRGKVTYRGNPVERGAIRFVTTNETEGVGGVAPITNGQYAIDEDEMYAGNYLVMISAFEYTGRTITIDEGNEVKEERQYLPARYNRNSNERVELAPGENVIDFQLTD